MVIINGEYVKSTHTHVYNIFECRSAIIPNYLELGGQFSVLQNRLSEIDCYIFIR